MFPLIKISCDKKSFEENARDSLLTDSNNIIFLVEYKNENEHRKEERKDGKRRETKTVKKRGKVQTDRKEAARLD